MVIDHAAVYTRRLEALRQFYETYFGAQAGTLYHNPKTGFSSYFLSFGGTGRLEIMARPGTSLRPKAEFLCGYAHLAFNLGSRTAVDELTKRLAAAGYRIKSGPRVTGDGYYESCFFDPDGNEIELVG